MSPDLSRVKHIFFDLDHTLWDFEQNARICLTEIFHDHRIAALGVTDFDLFFSIFSEVNRQFWYLLDTQQITHQELRRERFKATLDKCAVTISVEQSEAMNAQFLALLPKQSQLMPYTLQLLTTLHPHFHLHVLSNGFELVQRQKMASGGILDFFQHVITNDVAQAHKPSPAMFDFALSRIQSTPEEALMVGDNWVADIEGAIQMGIPAIHYDPAQHFISTPQFIRVPSLDQIPACLSLS